MYRVGGICMLVAGTAILVVAGLSIILGPPPGAGQEYLNALAGHPALANLNFGLFSLADVLLLLGALAVYLSLSPIAKNAMLVATTLFVLFVVLDLAITELNSLVLVALTGQYAVGDAQRSAAVAAADYVLTTIPIGTFASYQVSSVGLLITSVVMLKGVYSKPTAYAGLVASVAGIVGGFYLLLPALAILLTPSLVAFGIWSILAGARLVRFGQKAQP